MNIVIIHRQFHAQFERLGLFLAKNPSLRVYMLLCNVRQGACGRLQIRQYSPEKTVGKFPLEKEAAEGLAVVQALKRLREDENFVPDIILGTSGWGAMLFVKDLYPQAKVYQ